MIGALQSRTADRVERGGPAIWQGGGSRPALVTRRRSIASADRSETLVSRRLRRVGILLLLGDGRPEVGGGRQPLVELEVDLLAVEQLLDDLVRCLLAAGLQEAIGLENPAASLLVIWVL